MVNGGLVTSLTDTVLAIPRDGVFSFALDDIAWACQVKRRGYVLYLHPAQIKHRMGTNIRPYNLTEKQNLMGVHRNRAAIVRARRRESQGATRHRQHRSVAMARRALAHPDSWRVASDTKWFTGAHGGAPPSCSSIMILASANRRRGYTPQVPP